MGICSGPRIQFLFVQSCRAAGADQKPSNAVECQVLHYSLHPTTLQDDLAKLVLLDVFSVHHPRRQVIFAHPKLLDSIARTAIDECSEWPPRDLANSL